MKREWHHRQQMNILSMSAGVLRATTCEAFNKRHQVKIKRLSKDVLPKPSKPQSDRPKNQRKNDLQFATKKHQTKAKVQLISYHQIMFVM